MQVKISHLDHPGKDFFHAFRLAGTLTSGRLATGLLALIHEKRGPLAGSGLLIRRSYSIVGHMLVLPTAKVLLFIALNVGPQNPPVVYATSNSENYLWTQSDTGWTLEAKGFPASDSTRDPTKFVNFTGTPSQDSVPPYLRAVSRYHWHNNSVLVFDNGTRVEKRGDHAFLIINAGGANEKIFTILFPNAKS
jgi:hypothetical protein